MCGALLTGGKWKGRSAVVDHKIPATLIEIERFYDKANLWAVCKACHDGPCASIEAKHQDNAQAIVTAKEAYRPVGLDGYPIRRQ